MVGKILADPSFGLPGEEKRIEQKYPQVEIQETADDSSDAGNSNDNPIVAYAAKKNGNTSRSLSTSWKVLGITYAQVTTTLNFKTRDWRIKGINSCYGTIVNYIPLRQIDKHNTSSIKNGNATCITNASLARLLQKTVRGKHGFTVNSNGKFIKKWTLK